MRSRWSRMGVGHKVVAPFVGLTLFVGLLVSAIATQQLAASGAEQLDTIAVREQDNVNTVFNSIEERQLSDLRLLTSTIGVADAMRVGDTQTLERLLLPLVANELPVRIDVVVIQSNGDRLLNLAADPSHPDHCVCTYGGGKASFAHLDDVLRGRADNYGSRFTGLSAAGSSRLLYTIGPVIDRKGYLAGAVVVGETLDQILALVQDRAHVQLSLFGSDGTPIATTQQMDFPIPTLSGVERSEVLRKSSTVARRVSGSGHQAAVFYVPWVMRFETVGYAAIIVPADPVAGVQNLVVGVILVVGVAALALTLLVASIVMRSISKPMHELIKATTEVAAGNLTHRAIVESEDEIGQLATSFNLMTSVLAEMFDRLEKVTDETLVTLAAAIDARDPYTHGHSMRVSMYADALAARLGYSQSDRDTIKRGCMVHDIGKIGVPDSILRKAGPLDEKELNEMRQHPVIGHRVLSALPWDRTVFDIALHHHERWDGTGYPAGLAGDGIPRAARIVALADALDAMTSRRPYRPAFSFRLAAREILSLAGVQFDPELVAVFRSNRAEISVVVEGALQVWVPKVYRGRHRKTPVSADIQLEVVS